MKIKVLVALAAALFFTTCSKDKLSTKPQLKLESVNGDIFLKGSQIIFTLSATDKEGDIKDTLWVERVSLICPSQANIVIPCELPEFPKTNGLDADFIVTLNYGIGNSNIIPGCDSKDDSSYFRFWIKDNAQNTSDTIQSSALLLLN